MALSGLEVGNIETVRSVAGIEHSGIMGSAQQYRNFGITATFALKKHTRRRDVFFESKRAATIQKKENEAMSGRGHFTIMSSYV